MQFSQVHPLRIENSGPTPFPRINTATAFTSSLTYYFFSFNPDIDFKGN